MEPIHQKYKANERAQGDKTQRKKENKQLKKIIIIKSYANRTHGYKMTMNNNKEDLRRESFMKQVVGI
jgi:hypothetical protein